MLIIPFTFISNNITCTSMTDIPNLLPEIHNDNEEWQDKDWNLAHAKASQLFAPTSPIDQEKFFAGRLKQASDLLDSVYQKGAHSIIFGERGVGKSSLANIIRDKVPPQVSNICFVKQNCRPSDAYFDLWSNALYSFDYEDGGSISDALKGETREFVINKILERLDKTIQHVFIFDEFDRISDENVKCSMADTIKHFSDYPTNVTIIIVGVGFSIVELFGAHPSIERCCQQIPMSRMSQYENSQIIIDRLPDIGIGCPNNLINELVDLAQGFPGFAHLLGREAVLSAIRSRRRTITLSDIEFAVKSGEDKAQESLRRLFDKATYSAKKNKYKEVLLACALAKKNDFGLFSASDVAQELEKIYKKIGEYNKPLEISHFARHLAVFCDEDRGPVLRKTGKPKRFQYQFVNAPFQPYVKMKGRNLGFI